MAQIKPPLKRYLNYGRNLDIQVNLECASNSDCGISTYNATPSNNLAAASPLSFYGFNGQFDSSYKKMDNELFYLAHMYVPPFFDEVVNSKETKQPGVTMAANANQASPAKKEKGFLGLFMLRKYSTPSRHGSNRDQPVCKARGQYGCPLLVHMPKSFTISRAKDATADPDKAKEVLGYFTFNGMRFYPFIMIDFTVCYYVCDAKGAYDWNYGPDRKPLPATKIYPNVSINHPIQYDATLGLYVTRSAHLAKDPKRTRTR